MKKKPSFSKEEQNVESPQAQCEAVLKPQQIQRPEKNTRATRIKFPAFLGWGWGVKGQLQSRSAQSDTLNYTGRRTRTLSQNRSYLHLQATNQR